MSSSLSSSPSSSSLSSSSSSSSPPLASPVLIPSIYSILLLDIESGVRLTSKYFPPLSSTYRTADAQFALEKKIHHKILRSKGGVTSMDSECVVMEEGMVAYKFIGDIIIVVMGMLDENEILLCSVLSCIDDTLQSLLKGQVSKKSIIENLDFTLLVIDEICDEGIILEMDHQMVVQRVMMMDSSNSAIQGGQGQGGLGGQQMGRGGGDGGLGMGMGELSFTQALQTAKEQIYRSIK